LNSIKTVLQILKVDRPRPPRRTSQRLALAGMTLALGFWYLHTNATPFLAAIGLCWGTVILKPRVWRKFLLYTQWTVFHMIHAFLLLLLTALYLTLFSVMGALKRQSGWDPMRKKWVASALSYREEIDAQTGREFNRRFFERPY
jgi:hypothetical protein